MNATTAFNIFARAVVRERKIPFEIAASQPESTLATGYQAFMELRRCFIRNTDGKYSNRRFER